MSLYRPSETGAYIIIIIIIILPSIVPWQVGRMKNTAKCIRDSVYVEHIYGGKNEQNRYYTGARDRSGGENGGNQRRVKIIIVKNTNIAV